MLHHKAIKGSIDFYSIMWKSISKHSPISLLKNIFNLKFQSSGSLWRNFKFMDIKASLCSLLRWFGLAWNCSGRMVNKQEHIFDNTRRFFFFCPFSTWMPYRCLTDARMANDAGGTQPMQSSRGRQGHAPTALVTLQVKTGRQHRAKQPAHTKYILYADILRPSEKQSIVVLVE